MRRRFEPIQRRVEARTEPASTRLTAPPLDLLGFAVAPIAHDGMDIRIADPVVHSDLIGTGEALGLHPFGRSSSAFHLAPRMYWGRFSCPRR
jgi:hypothetical protein